MLLMCSVIVNAPSADLGGCFGGCSTPGYELQKKNRERERKERKKERKKEDLLQSCYATPAVIKLLTPTRHRHGSRGWGNIAWSV